MGYSIAWIAVKTDDPDALYGELEVRPTGEPDQHFESPICGGKLSGWFLLIRSDCDFIDDAFLTKCSADREVIACSVYESVMYSSAAQWENGRCNWSIVHDSDRGMLDLTVTGEPPALFEQIRADHLARQEAEGGADADVDHVFDIPLQVAKSLVGFKHDEANQWVDDAVFETFDDASPAAQKPWWRFW